MFCCTLLAVACLAYTHAMPYRGQMSNMDLDNLDAAIPLQMSSDPYSRYNGEKSDIGEVTDNTMKGNKPSRMTAVSYSFRPDYFYF